MSSDLALGYAPKLSTVSCQEQGLGKQLPPVVLAQLVMQARHWKQKVEDCMICLWRVTHVKLGLSHYQLSLLQCNPECSESAASFMQMGHTALGVASTHHSLRVSHATCIQIDHSRLAGYKTHTYAPDALLPAAQVCTRMMPGYGEQMRSISLR